MFLPSAKYQSRQYNLYGPSETVDRKFIVMALSFKPFYNSISTTVLVYLKTTIVRLV